MKKPTVLHFIICDRVLTDPDNLRAINVEGTKWSIRSTQERPFPCRVAFLTVLTVFMGGHGQARFSYRLVQDKPQKMISESTQPHSIRFTGDEQEVFGIKGFLEHCIFPNPGLCWVELVLAGSVIARQPLRLS